ncbi:MAG: ABC transporter substrate-binding protein, partial [Alphaproteobacteria bacterium]|nr:ABC transporter substrate-binding protein [Alphaproteobacteria bacterium]
MRVTMSARLATAMVAAFALTATAARSQTAPSADTIVVAQGADAYTMDPAKHSVFPTASILFHVYDPLITQDASGKFQPALAESWSNPDATTWQFKLRRNVKFHNGEEFDAEAVKFTFDRALNPE